MEKADRKQPQQPNQPQPQSQPPSIPQQPQLPIAMGRYPIRPSQKPGMNAFPSKDITVLLYWIHFYLFLCLLGGMVQRGYPSQG